MPHRPSTASGVERDRAVGLRILLVEDDDLVASVETDYLEELGHTVIARASNLREAMFAVRRSCPDVALVDIRLADGDNGLDVARRMLAEHGVRSIFVSGSLFPDDGISAFRGTNPLAFVAKPFNRRSMEAALALAADRVRQSGVAAKSTPPPSQEPCGGVHP